MSGRARELKPATLATLAMTAAVACVSACPVGNVGTNDVVGAKGVVAFSTETATAFSTRLVVGSSFVVTLKAVDAKQKTTVASGSMNSVCPVPLDA